MSVQNNQTISWCQLKDRRKDDDTWARDGDLRLIITLPLCGGDFKGII